MRVAGVDASTKMSGVAIMSDGVLERYLLIDLHKEKDAIKRIKSMMIQLAEMLDRYQLDKVYMEKSICKGGNVDTTQKLSYLAGGIMFYCSRNGIEFVNPLPSEWRKKIGLKQSSKVKREILKAEAIYAVKKEYGLDVNDDVAESVLLARSAFDLPKIEIPEDLLM
jgi:Holliday junction resolvasome RuvABC endonuclease subunit